MSELENPFPSLIGMTEDARNEKLANVLAIDTADPVDTATNVDPPVVTAFRAFADAGNACCAHVIPSVDVITMASLLLTTQKRVPFQAIPDHELEWMMDAAQVSPSGEVRAR